MDFLESYIIGEQRAAKFFGSHFADQGAWHSVADLRSRHGVPAALLAALERSATSPGAQRAVKKLKQPGALCVVTGQQTGLFLGPLLTLYKIITAIRWSQILEQALRRPVTAVFWVQSEDHDFDEIRHCVIPDSIGPSANLELPAISDSRRSVHSVLLGPALESLKEFLREALMKFPEGPKCWELVDRHYRPGCSAVESFKGAFGELLAEQELAFFDPVQQKASFFGHELYRRAADEHEQITSELERTALQLEGVHFAPQVHIRRDSPLFFVHPDGQNGDRYRLVRSASRWDLIGSERFLSDGELCEILEGHPEKLSSSALFRPLIQDALLPTIMYIGGPSELKYLAQIGSLYDRFGITRPLIAPRCRFRLIDEKSQRILSALGLSAGELSRPKEELEAILTDNNQALEAEVNEGLSKVFAVLSESFQQVDGSLLGALEKTRQKIGGHIDGLMTKYRAAVLRNDTTALERLKRVQSLLWPGGQPQEVVYGLIYYIARYGEKLIHDLLEIATPLDPRTKDVFCSGDFEK